MDEKNNSGKVLLDPPKFYLGASVTDEVTGIVGVATARIEYLDGTTQYQVQPPIDQNGNYREGVYIDQARLDYSRFNTDAAKGAEAVKQRRP